MPFVISGRIRFRLSLNAGVVLDNRWIAECDGVQRSRCAARSFTVLLFILRMLGMRSGWRVRCWTESVFDINLNYQFLVKPEADLNLNYQPQVSLEPDLNSKCSSRSSSAGIPKFYTRKYRAINCVSTKKLLSH